MTAHGLVSRLAAFALLVGCAGTTEDAGSSADELRTRDARDTPDPSDGPPAREPCTSTFGSGLSSGSYGRLDGILVAVVPPRTHGCSGDAHHVHLQIAMQGSVYDVAVNVEGVDFGQTDAPMAGTPWSEGWHSDASLDYPTALGMHSGDFASMGESELADSIASAVAQANHVSIFGTKYSKGGTHLIHRNGRGNDGAIVIHPLSGRPRYLVFHFPRQTF